MPKTMFLRSATVAAFVIALAACTPAGSPTLESSATAALSAPAVESASVAESASAAESASVDASPSLASGTMTSTLDLLVGDCFNTSEQDRVNEVEVVPCTQLHDYELYAAFDYAAGGQDPYPGDDEIDTFADDGCVDAFEPFVGSTYDASELYIFYLKPSEETWSAGDREVLCTLYLPDAQLEGSMEGSSR